MRPLLAAALVAVTALPAAAGGTEFRTPSNNIECYYETAEKTLVCTRFKPNVQSVFLFVDDEPNVGPPETARTSADERLPVLAYGRTWQRGPVTCISENTGLTCRTARHSFTLSRAGIKSH